MDTVRKIRAIVDAYRKGEYRLSLVLALRLVAELLESWDGKVPFGADLNADTETLLAKLEEECACEGAGGLVIAIVLPILMELVKRWIFTH